MDKDRAKAFMTTMVGFMNSGSMALMCSIGHRTGLFDTMASSEPFTSESLAEATELNERYVREWLWAMASGGVVDYTEASETFTLPEEHRMLVSRAGGPMNLAATLQYVALMGKVEDDVVEAFRTGEGVGYDRYPDFQHLMAEQSAARFDAGLIDQMLPNIPGAVEALTTGATLADVGCGRGHAVLLMARHFPNSTFVGFDFSADAVAHANDQAGELGLDNASFRVADAAQLESTDQFDFITTFDAIHDQAHPAVVLANIHAMLRPGGHYLCVEPKAQSALADNMDEPGAPFTYTISTMHCMSVSIAGGGEGLGTAWGEQQITAYLEAAGFRDVEPNEVKVDSTNTHFVATKPA